MWKQIASSLVCPFRNVKDEVCIMLTWDNWCNVAMIPDSLIDLM